MSNVTAAGTLGLGLGLAARGGVAGPLWGRRGRGPGSAWLGRFALGDEVPLALHLPGWPDADPTATILRMVAVAGEGGGDDDPAPAFDQGTDPVAYPPDLDPESAPTDLPAVGADVGPTVAFDGTGGGGGGGGSGGPVPAVEVVATLVLAAAGPPAGRFALGYALGSLVVGGTYTVAYAWVRGGVHGVALDRFGVVAGGDGGGSVISLCAYDRPEAKFVVAHLASGKLVYGRGPGV